MNASDVKDALRRRHPGAPLGGMPGQWTCLEELYPIWPRLLKEIA